MHLSINHGFVELELASGWLFFKLGKREWAAERSEGRWSFCTGVWRNAGAV
jgi:hypothetical protein